METPSPKSWHDTFMEERERLIKGAASTLFALKPGLYVLFPKDHTSEVEPRTVVIFNVYVQKHITRYFNDFYFVKI